MPSALNHLAALESEAVHIIREVVAEARNPVMLFSAGKDSTVMAHFAIRTFYPGTPPFPLLHVDSTWEFRALIEFRDAFARKHGWGLITHANEQGREAGINPFDHGERLHLAHAHRAVESSSRRWWLRHHLRRGSARRRDVTRQGAYRVDPHAAHTWEPRQQRPELWKLYNARLAVGQTARVFPLSNWTEMDIWAYALLNDIELAPLYYAAPRPVVERGGAFIVVDDESRMRFRPGEQTSMRKVRFRTLGCWPVTGAIESDASDLRAVVDETLRASSSERQGRVGDR